MEPSPLSKEGGVRTVIFNGKNFENWKYSVSIALKGNKLIPIVDGTHPRPPEVNTDVSIQTYLFGTH